MTNGADGNDGYSPTASVTKSGNTATITITDQNGTTTAQVYDGQGNVTDVQVNGTSVLSGTVANIDITGKADKVSGAVSGNFAGLDANGNLTDSGHKHSDYQVAGLLFVDSNGYISIDYDKL